MLEKYFFVNYMCHDDILGGLRFAWNGNFAAAPLY